MLGAPQYAPLAPLVSALLRGHMIQTFVPAYADYTLAEERRVPAARNLPLPSADDDAGTAAALGLVPGFENAEIVD